MGTLFLGVYLMWTRPGQADFLSKIGRGSGGVNFVMLCKHF